MQTWITGRVVPHEGPWPSEDVTVVATLASESMRWSAVAEPDGFFALEVPESASQLGLTIESRFLHLPHPVQVFAGATEVVLEPRADAVVEGMLVPPLSLATLDASWGEGIVELESKGWGVLLQRPPTHAQVRPDVDGAFALANLPPGAELLLRVHNPFGPDAVEELEPLAPGELRRVEIRLQLGITLSGTVLDEHDQPVSFVSLELGRRFSDPEQPWGPEHRCQSEPDLVSDSGGRFVIPRVERGAAVLRTVEEKLLRQGVVEFDGRKGDVSGLVLRVERGRNLKGTVSWPDGSPAESFEVTASGGRYQQTHGRSGRFELAGLAEGSCRIEAKAQREGVVGSVLLEIGPSELGPVALVLEEERAFALSGTVVDASGSPIQRFHASALKDSQNLNVDGWEGRFVLSGLDAGLWQLRVTASEYLPFEESIELPAPAASQLRIMLAKAGRVRGHVLSAGGTPVRGAWVGEESWAPMARSSSEDEVTDSQGAFDITARSDRPRLVALANGHAGSEVLELEVPAGIHVEGVVLRLREERPSRTRTWGLPA